MDDEVTDTLKQLRSGLPVLIEHKGEPVGSVIYGYRTHQGDICVILRIDTSTPHGAFARESVINGSLGSLSFGSTAAVGEHGLRFSPHTFKEISLVERGAVDRSRIFTWQDEDAAGSILNVSVGACKEVFTNTTPFSDYKMSSAESMHANAQATYAAIIEAVDRSTPVGGIQRQGVRDMAEICRTFISNRLEAILREGSPLQVFAQNHATEAQKATLRDILQQAAGDVIIKNFDQIELCASIASSITRPLIEQSEAMLDSVAQTSKRAPERVVEAVEEAAPPAKRQRVSDLIISQSTPPAAKDNINDLRTQIDNFFGGAMPAAKTPLAETSTKKI